jgi:hypothetical protein
LADDDGASCVAGVERNVDTERAVEPEVEVFDELDELDELVAPDDRAAAARDDDDAVARAASDDGSTGARSQCPPSGRAVIQLLDSDCAGATEGAGASGAGANGRAVPRPGRSSADVALYEPSWVFGVRYCGV